MIIVQIPGAVVVVADMSLAMVSVFFNLVVITSIRRKEEIISVTFNLVILIMSTALSSKSLQLSQSRCFYFQGYDMKNGDSYNSFLFLN